MRILILALFFGLVVAMDFSKTLEGEVVTLKEDSLDFKSSSELRVGEIGLVVKKVLGDSGEWQDVGTSVKITKKKDNIYSAKIILTKELVQPYLPTPTNKPKVGDKVLFHSQNLRAFLIAPNEDVYLKASSQLRAHDIISSDVLEGFLASHRAASPTRELLSKACQVYSTNLIFIYQKSLKAYDCQSFTELGSSKLENPNSKESVFPFFARIRATHQRGLFSFSSSKHNDYDELYSQILDPRL